MFLRTILDTRGPEDMGQITLVHIYEFGYNDLTIGIQRDIAPVVRGNVGGRYEKKKWFTVSDEPVHKRKKK